MALLTIKSIRLAHVSYGIRAKGYMHKYFLCTTYGLRAMGCTHRIELTWNIINTYGLRSIGLLFSIEDPPWP